jgi:hypothetical protein
MDRFNLSDWRRVCVPVEPLPADACVIACIDPCFGHKAHSDETGMAVSWCRPLSDETHEMVLLDARGVKKKGGLLADAIVDFLERWHPEFCHIEGNPASHLLADAVAWRAEPRGVLVNIRVPTVDNTRKAKCKRIGRLQDYITSNPPRLRLQYGEYLKKLFEQIESFTFQDGNKGRKDDVLDSVSMLMTHLPF